MAEIQCKICHKDVTFADDITVFVCPHCGNWAVVPQITDEETALLHRRAEEFRKNGEFAKSVAVYEQLAHENPHDSEIYWGMFLAKFGVEYILDPAADIYVPVCRINVDDPVLEDPDYQTVLQLAGQNTIDIYENEARRIAFYQGESHAGKQVNSEKDLRKIVQERYIFLQKYLETEEQFDSESELVPVLKGCIAEAEKLLQFPEVLTDEMLQELQEFCQRSETFLSTCGNIEEKETAVRLRKQRWKKILKITRHVVLWLIFVLAAVPLIFLGGNALIKKYNLVSGNVCEIQGDVVVGVKYEKNEILRLEIPQGVTRIASNAFAFCKNLETVTIPDSVKKIGYEIFEGCNNLKTITVFAKNKEHLYQQAFNSLPREKLRITMPDNVTLIDYEAFADCENLKYFVIPDSVTQISSRAFYFCKNLKSVLIPGSVTRIGDFAFAYCENLESLIIPDSVTEISSKAFYSCQNLKNILIPGSVTRIGDFAFAGCKNLEEVKIPEGVVDIGEKAFTHCENLKTVTIPASVKEIGNWAFYECENLETVTIPDSIEKIGQVIFGGCDNLKTIKISCQSPKVVRREFYRKHHLLFSRGTVTSVTLSENVTEIGDFAFEDCRFLKEIILPASVTQIGEMAFSRCRNLKTITISGKVTNVHESAFYGCTNLREIRIPRGAVFNCQSNGVKYYENVEDISKRKTIGLPSNCRIVRY